MKKIVLLIACLFFIPIQSMQRTNSWSAGEDDESLTLGQKMIANPAYGMVQEQWQAEANSRDDQWRQWKAQAPRALKAAPEETLLFFKHITDDVVEWGSLPFTNEIDFSAQRLLGMALFCQTKDMLITAHSKNVSVWSLLDNHKKKIETMDGGALTGQDRALIYQLCRDGTVGAHHDDEPCLGKAKICKNCKRLISVLACLEAVGNCCKQTAFPAYLDLVKEYEGSACSICMEKLRHKLLLRVKSLIIGFHQFQLPLKTPDDIALVKWAIFHKK